MAIKKGETVTRISYNHDIVFKVISIKEEIAYLKGVEVRLYADAPLNDLVPAIVEEITEEETKSDRRYDDYFYMPAKILHLDGDDEYLRKSLNYYASHKINAVGKKISEEQMAPNIEKLLNEYRPDIIVLTGHDAFYTKKGPSSDANNYKFSNEYIKAIKIARRYEKSFDKLVVIAGACQSNYEQLILAGANYASSPKRVNIHALDPAIIATELALTPRDQDIDIISLLSKTKYGADGMGGIISKGLMYIGYPRA